MAPFQLLSLVVITLAMSHSSSQGPLPTSTTTPAPRLNAAARAYLDAHNSARAEVGVQPLKWSRMLKNDASFVVQYQRDQQGCNFTNLSGIKYGMNQFWTGGPSVLPQEAVRSWVDTKKYYNYANNSCQAGEMCGVYKQVVWRKSLELACAQASCANSALTICFYNPPGNILGQKPY